MGAQPALADPAPPKPIIDMSVCTAGPLLCGFSGLTLTITDVMIGNTMGLISYGLCTGPVPPGHGSILPDVIYDNRPWCAKHPPQ